jgi:hypothetical protein
MIDDNLRILNAVKKVWGERVTTVLPRQGLYARDSQILAGCQPADEQLRLGCIRDHVRETKPCKQQEYCMILARVFGFNAETRNMTKLQQHPASTRNMTEMQQGAAEDGGNVARARREWSKDSPVELRFFSLRRTPS